MGQAKTRPKTFHCPGEWVWKEALRRIDSDAQRNFGEAMELHKRANELRELAQRTLAVDLNRFLVEAHSVDPESIPDGVEMRYSLEGQGSVTILMPKGAEVRYQEPEVPVDPWEPRMLEGGALERGESAYQGCLADLEQAEAEVVAAHAELEHAREEYAQADLVERADHVRTEYLAEVEDDPPPDEFPCGPPAG